MEGSSPADCPASGPDGVRPRLDGDAAEQIVNEVVEQIVNEVRSSYGVSAAGVVVEESGGLSLMAGEGLPVGEIDTTSVLHDTLRRRIPSVILDASLDERYQDDPLVRGPLGLRFFVRAPVLTRDLKRIGTLVLADEQPRSSFMLDECEELLAAAARISDHMSKCLDPDEEQAQST